VDGPYTLGMMNSLVYAQRRLVEWREAPAPSLTFDTDVLVRPIASGFCDLDRAIAHGRTPLPGPFALGHEAVAEVVDAGTVAARSLSAGQHVVVPFSISCGTCDRCRAGRPVSCRRTPWLASYGNPVGGNWGGLFDDLVRVPHGATCLVPLPAGMSPLLAASVGDNLTDAFHGVGPYLDEHPDASVLVLGGTPALGLMITMFAVVLGAGSVTYLDNDPQRCAMAGALGATVMNTDLPDRVDGEYDLVVEAHGDPRRAPAVAVRSVRPGGHCHVRCVYFGDVALPFLEAAGKGVTIEVGLPQVPVLAPRVLEIVSAASDALEPLLRPHRDWALAPDVVLDSAPGKPVFLRA
jgi:threonine dehydrogenase-like Zn-dependent dehydrogenase